MPNTAERWRLCEQQLAANSMNLMQVNIMTKEDGRERVDTVYMRKPSIALALISALGNVDAVLRIDALTPMGELILEWKRNG